MLATAWKLDVYQACPLLFQDCNHAFTVPPYTSPSGNQNEKGKGSLSRTLGQDGAPGDVDREGESPTHLHHRAVPSFAVAAGVSKAAVNPGRSIPAVFRRCAISPCRCRHHMVTFMQAPSTCACTPCIRCPRGRWFGETIQPSHHLPLASQSVASGVAGCGFLSMVISLCVQPGAAPGEGEKYASRNHLVRFVAIG